MKIYQPKILSSMKNYSTKQLTKDLIAGLIVAIIALPLSIALAIASGVTPEMGLYTAIVAGFLVALFGGSSVNITGPTAAFATIVAGIVLQHGISGLALATLMAGVLLILMGLFRFGSLIKFIPHTITTGFTAGIAVTIVIGQVKDFLGLTFAPGTVAVETVEKVEAIVHSFGSLNPYALLVGGVALAILIVWPKINKTIPGSLIAVVVGVLMVKLLPIPVATIGDLYQISGGLPKFSFSFAGIDLNTVKALLPSAFTIALLAGIESLLSCVVSDGMVGDKHDSNSELIAQGIGNIGSALLGGIPATGAIARTAANVKNGGKTPIAGIVHALVLLLILVVLMPYAAWIPMPVIAAILFMVAYNMCGWRGFVKICRVAPATDILVLVLTFVLTVVFDLVIAIEVGMILAAVLFMVRMAGATHVRKWEKWEEEKRNLPTNADVIEINGPMFFAASDRLSQIPLDEDAEYLILRMGRVPSVDVTAIQVIENLVSACKNSGVTLLITKIGEQPKTVLKRSGLLEQIGEEHIFDGIDSAFQYIESQSTVNEVVTHE